MKFVYLNLDVKCCDWLVVILMVKLACHEMVHVGFLFWHNVSLECEILVPVSFNTSCWL